jgi:hypothetical protein
MREDPFISQAMVYGDRRPYPVALVALDREQLLQFARTHDIPSSDYTQLTRHPKVLERIVADKNARLPSYWRERPGPGSFTRTQGPLVSCEPFSAWCASFSRGNASRVYSASAVPHAIRVKSCRCRGSRRRLRPGMSATCEAWTPHRSSQSA